ncbi:ankyrin repeat-containing domain protein [Dactylonectria estremocensis]|uniref:Ankyrin repeat-containing domain protein n=1 Tax=Dactylonectria estremocensis TaxID=1079267 RepID=A0A9P9EX11_9HYPO|nr:ankyrin repeat-containing domain protein [Dactylonectria estremocensis]
MLLDTGKVDADSRDKSGRSPLSWAAGSGNEAVVKMLLDTGKNGNEAVVKILLDRGKVNVDLRDKSGRSPLLWAAWNGNEAAVKLLLDMGKVDVDARDKNGRSPLSWAAKKGYKGKYRGIPPPLTAWNGNEAVVKILLNTGKVDVDARDKNGRSPLSWAAEKGREAVVKMLLDTGKVDMATEDALFAERSSTIRYDALHLVQDFPVLFDV